MAIDPAPHPISSTDSPGFNANSFIKSRAYGAVSSGRKCRARLSHSKGSSARRRSACRRIHSPFQSAERSSERASPSTTGQPPSSKKSDSSQKKSRNQHISERTDPTPNRRINHVVQERSNCNMGQNPAKVEMCGSPGEGKYIRSIASSARAGEHVMCSPCESGLSEQAALYICPPRGSSPVLLS